MLMEPISPIVSNITNSPHQHSLLNYSYNYYQHDSNHFHDTYPVEVFSEQQQLQRQQQQQQQQQEQPQQQQQEQSQQQLQQLKLEPLKRHTYMTCYGTEENIYEEISEIG